MLGSGRVIIGDSWFDSYKTAHALIGFGLYSILNVKTGKNTSQSKSSRMMYPTGMIRHMYRLSCLMTASQSTGVHTGMSRRWFWCTPRLHPFPAKTGPAYSIGGTASMRRCERKSTQSCSLRFLKSTIAHSGWWTGKIKCPLVHGVYAGR